MRLQGDRTVNKKDELKVTNKNLPIMQTPNLTDRIIYDEKELPILIKRIGEDHPDVAFSYSHWGEVYNKKGILIKLLPFMKKHFQFS